MTRASPKMLIPLQMAAALLALVALAMWPPAAGAMLLVPLGHGGADAAARLALAGGGRLLGAGPFRGSLVVVGDRSRIAREIRSWNVVIVAAPPAACGSRGTFRGVA